MFNEECVFQALLWNHEPNVHGEVKVRIAGCFADGSEIRSFSNYLNMFFVGKMEKPFISPDD
jgi:hypothetical protein